MVTMTLLDTHIFLGLLIDYIQLLYPYDGELNPGERADMTDIYIIYKLCNLELSPFEKAQIMVGGRHLKRVLEKIEERE